MMEKDYVKKVGLTTLTFDNYEQILRLKPMDSQKEFVEDWATILALAYIGENLNLNGKLYIITYNDIPVGRGLIGKSEVGIQEPVEIQKYGFAYRIMGFFIDKKYQGLGIGKIALGLLLDKIKEYPDGNKLPITLEINNNNTVARKMYQAVGFCDTGIRYGEDCAYVKKPGR